MRLIFTLLCLSVIAAAQTAGDPCGAFAKVGGWLVTLKVSGSGTSYPGSPPYSRKHDLSRTASVNAPLVHLRDQSSIYGPNGEVIQVVYEGHGNTSVHVTDHSYIGDSLFGWQLVHVWEGGGDVSTAYDSPENSFISFQPTIDGRCSVISQLPAITDVTSSYLDDKTWKTQVIPYGWSTQSGLDWKPGQPSLLGGSANLIWDYVTSPDPDYPPTISKSIKIHELGGNGALVDWNVEWFIEPVGLCSDAGAQKLALRAAVAPEKPVISGPKEMWWFNGESVKNYDTEISLRATPPTACPCDWEVDPATSSKVTLKRNTNGLTVQLTSLAPTDIGKDLRVRVKRNGIFSDWFAIRIKTPHSLWPGGWFTFPDAKFGYRTQIEYVTLDQHGEALPHPIPGNENFTDRGNPTHIDKTGADGDWLQHGPPNGIDDVMVFADTITGEAVSRSIPPPTFTSMTPPNDPANKIVHWAQTFSVGSLVPGKGVLVQANRLQRYIDHGAHLCRKSPAPAGTVVTSCSE